MAYEWGDNRRPRADTLAAADAAGHRAVRKLHLRNAIAAARDELEQLEADERREKLDAKVRGLREELRRARERRDRLTDTIRERSRFVGASHDTLSGYQEQEREAAEDVRKLEAAIAKVTGLEVDLATTTQRAPSAARAKRARGALSLLVALAADRTPPTEIRLFRRGVNETEKGPYLFDAEAASRVMQHYEARGVDVMIDLEHGSTEPDAPNYDPDARGWAQLELRNGELWAVGIKWTADGARRITAGLQRYVSPYFGWEETSDGQRRIVELVNFAICANPATHDPPALIAASKAAP